MTPGLTDDASRSERTSIRVPWHGGTGATDGLRRQGQQIDCARSGRAWYFDAERQHQHKEARGTVGAPSLVPKAGTNRRQIELTLIDVKPGKVMPTGVRPTPTFATLTG